MYPAWGENSADSAIIKCQIQREYVPRILIYTETFSMQFYLLGHWAAFLVSLNMLNRLFWLSARLWNNLGCFIFLELVLVILSVSEIVLFLISVFNKILFVPQCFIDRSTFISTIGNQQHISLNSIYWYQLPLYWRTISWYFVLKSLSHSDDQSTQSSNSENNLLDWSRIAQLCAETIWKV